RQSQRTTDREAKFMNLLHGFRKRRKIRDPTRNRVRAINFQFRVIGIERRVLRSEEHTSELQSLRHLVCRLLLEKKKKKEKEFSQPIRHRNDVASIKTRHKKR